MGNIITPKTRLNRGREKWINKDHKKKNSQPEKVVRTGKDTFTVKHDDGSSFDCKVDPRKIRFREDRMKDAGGVNKVFSMGSPCTKCESKWHSKCK